MTQIQSPTWNYEDVVPAGATGVTTAATDLGYRGGSTKVQPPVGYYGLIVGVGIANPSAALIVTLQITNGTDTYTLDYFNIPASGGFNGADGHDFAGLVIPAGFYPVAKTSTGTVDVAMTVKMLKGGQ